MKKRYKDILGVDIQEFCSTKKKNRKSIPIP